MSVSKDEVQKLAELSRIELLSEEIELMRVDIESILSYIETIQKIDLPDIPDGTVYLDEVNVMRDDGEPHAPKMYTENLLKQASRREKDFVKVKKILG